jgi:hypothetical protein
MDVQKLAVYYPNGQPMLEIGPITGCSVSDVIQLAAAGMSDVISKMPEITKNARELFEAYQNAKIAAEASRDKGVATT